MRGRLRSRAETSSPAGPRHRWVRVHRDEPRPRPAAPWGLGARAGQLLARGDRERNRAHLESLGEASLELVDGDVRDASLVAEAAADADAIFHLAAQVAVTDSVRDPRNDFEVNALGTLNVLEGARLSGRQPLVVYTSTNKVYGGLEDLEVVGTGDAVRAAGAGGRRTGDAAGRLPLALRLLEGRGRPVRDRLRADLRDPDRRLPPVVHLRAVAVRQRGSGLDGALPDPRAARRADHAVRRRPPGSGRPLRRRPARALRRDGRAARGRRRPRLQRRRRAGADRVPARVPRPPARDRRPRAGRRVRRVAAGRPAGLRQRHQPGRERARLGAVDERRGRHAAASANGSRRHPADARRPRGSRRVHPVVRP